MKRSKVAIIGAGPAGCMCAYYSQKENDVTLFEAKSPLHTLLYTGGGRCNLAHEEYDLKELAKNYPRGEKFLYSIFSKFSTGDTLAFFENIGVKTYTQDDYRIFPISNSAVEVKNAILKSLSKCSIKKEKVLRILSENNTFKLTTDKDSYEFDKIVLAVGGHAGFSLAEKLGHTIIEPKPALVGLITKENLKPLQGVSLKQVEAVAVQNSGQKIYLKDDLLFTHEGISGPLAYKISSICAREDYSQSKPLKIYLNLLRHAEFISASIAQANNGKILKQVQDDGVTLWMQSLLNENPKKDVKNLISDFVPKSLAEFILKQCDIAPDTKCHQINGQKRDSIYKFLTEFELNIVSPAKEGEVVTSGGVKLDEINQKTMESKLVEGLYFCGEVINVDGFCGGFNLQNCWSTGFVAGSSI